MPDTSRTILWIASYPKSGNTWVRFLVCNLVFGPQSSAAALNRLAPDIHELPGTLERPAATALLKTHFPFSSALPLAEHTAGALYVVRHPADVMLSNFHYARRRGSAGGEDRAELSQYLGRYLAARGDPRWVDLKMGGWDENVRSWLAVKHPFPVLLLRYEDLLAGAERGARQICAFLGLARSDEQIERAVSGASFRRMREIEQSDIDARRVGIFYKPYLQPSIDAGLRFMRAGRAGEGAQVLTADERRRIEAAFGPVMRELGYGLTAPAQA